MLITTIAKLLVKDSIFDSKNKITNRIGDDVNKIFGAKSKNMVIPKFLTVFKLLVELIFRPGFLISEINNNNNVFIKDAGLSYKYAMQL